MKTFLDCAPCFLRQALEASRMATDDEELQGKILREVARELTTFSFTLSPPHMGQRLHQIVRELSGDQDPYREVKRGLNELAVELYPRLKRKVRKSSSPRDTAIQLSLAGNILDCGPPGALGDDGLQKVIEAATSQDLVLSDVDGFWKEVDKAQDILFLGDNAGEIGLDKILLEELPSEKVTFVVRGKPIINDATREDAEHVGLTEIVEVMDNGSDAPGTILETCSPEFRRRFERADLIVSKGQGNYETLSDQNKNMFFLLKVKCPVIARDIRCREGAMVVKGQKGR